MNKTPVRSLTVLSLLIALLAASAAAQDEPDISDFERRFTAAEREHWSFQPVRRPEVPRREPAAHFPVRNPIDAFIFARLDQEGIQPAPEADRRTLMRRLYFDLIGLPPTIEEQEAFLSDTSPDAYERLVDRLLDSPHYGERWARYWLDVARYAESNGYERDGAKPSAWRYRDWVIESLNHDKPYDRFIIEQIAGDLIPERDAETMIATTFLRLGTWDDEPADPTVDRYDQLDDVVGTTSAAFLGVTLRCARCHDHKYEPFTQADYYRFLAFFEPLRRPQEGRTEFDVPVGTPEELAAYEEATAQADAEVARLEAEIEAIDAGVRERLFQQDLTFLPEAVVVAFQTPADQRNNEQRRLVEEHRARLAEEIAAHSTPDETARRDGLQAEIETVNVARPPEPPRAYIFLHDQEPTTTHILRRGDPRNPAVAVQPGFPAVLDQAAAANGETAALLSRLDLARWIASSQNPLTVRVWVNRVWQGHFGEGLVASENDFGVMGYLPTHPELLDWLAAEFVAGGWSTKSLHRLILTSSTYRMASVHDDARAAAVDPDNGLLWRFPLRRLEAEPLRDAVLAVSGRINLERGGPSVYPPIPPEVLAGQSRPGEGWHTSEEPAASRRSIYIFVKRSLLVPELEIMDFADTTSSCEDRQVSTIAPQALTFLNGEFMNEQAAFFAERLIREAGDDPQAQVERAFLLALARPPTERERAASLTFLEEQRAQIGAEAAEAGQTGDDAPRRALEAFCLVLYNLNEFAYAE